MRLYKATIVLPRYDNDEPETKTRFCGSQSEVSAAKKEWREGNGLKANYPVTVDEVEVETGKQGLIAFLNKLVG